jgi:hypothetical protein
LTKKKKKQKRKNQNETKKALKILFSQPPRFWDYRCVPPYPARTDFFANIFIDI